MLKLPNSAPVVVNASLFKRFFAFVFDLLMIDLIILSPFRGILSGILPGNAFSNAYSFVVENSRYATLLSMILLVVSVLAMVYFVALEKLLGQTPGKMIFNLHVVSETGSVWAYVLRSLFVVPIVPFILLWLVDPVYIFFNEDHQRLTERLGRTKVVEKIYW
jgi:uncharacterized RDD family membrane protein YckC